VTEHLIRTSLAVVGCKSDLSTSETNQNTRLPPVVLLVRHCVMLGCTRWVRCGMDGGVVFAVPPDLRPKQSADVIDKLPSISSCNHVKVQHYTHRSS